MHIHIKPGEAEPAYASHYVPKRVVGYSKTVHLCPVDPYSKTLCGKTPTVTALGWDSYYPWTLCRQCAKIAYAEEVRKEHAP